MFPRHLFPAPRRRARRLYPRFLALLVGCALGSPLSPANAATTAADGLRYSRHPELPSARIAQLKKEIGSNRDQALQAFWNEIRTRGTPLIEPISGDAAHVHVTFLWRGDRGTKNVVVQPFLRDPQYDYALTQLRDTDVWYTTIRMRAGGRFVYRIAENVPVFPNVFPDARAPKDDREAFEDALKPDPLNNRQLPPRGDPAARFATVFSLVVMPGASPEPWAEKRADVSAGQSTQTTLRSERLKNKRSITVYTPPGYSNAAEPYPLLFIFDEDRYLTQIPAATIVDNLIAEKRIPPLVMVLIGNPSRQTRMVELPCNPAFVGFLGDELVPWVREHYHVSKDPARAIVAGSSYGGLASAYAALLRPDLFGNVLSQSGSFGWTPPPDPAKPREFDPEREKNYVASLFLAKPALPVRFYLDVGTEEIDFSLPGARNLIPTRHIRDVLRAQGREVRYREFIGGHDEASWRATFPEGLIALIGTPPPTGGGGRE